MPRHVPPAAGPASPDAEEPAVEWSPVLAKKAGATKHKLLTDRLIGDIESGVLAPRTRLPTHRDLARRLGVSVQTVSISYKEAERRGYLRGEVGRGTYVRDRVTERADRFMLDRSPGDAADLSIIRAVSSDIGLLRCIE